MTISAKGKYNSVGTSRVIYLSDDDVFAKLNIEDQGAIAGKQKIIFTGTNDLSVSTTIYMECRKDDGLTIYSGESSTHSFSKILNLDKGTYTFKTTTEIQSTKEKSYAMKKVKILLDDEGDFPASPTVERDDVLLVYDYAPNYGGFLDNLIHMRYELGHINLKELGYDNIDLPNGFPNGYPDKFINMTYADSLQLRDDWNALRDDVMRAVKSCRKSFHIEISDPKENTVYGAELSLFCKIANNGANISDSRMIIAKNTASIPDFSQTYKLDYTSDEQVKKLAEKVVSSTEKMILGIFPKISLDQFFLTTNYGSSPSTMYRGIFKQTAWITIETNLSKSLTNASKFNLKFSNGKIVTLSLSAAAQTPMSSSGGGVVNTNSCSVEVLDSHNKILKSAISSQIGDVKLSVELKNTSVEQIYSSVITLKDFGSITVSLHFKLEINPRSLLKSHYPLSVFNFEYGIAITLTPFYMNVLRFPNSTLEYYTYKTGSFIMLLLAVGVITTGTFVMAIG